MKKIIFALIALVLINNTVHCNMHSLVNTTKQYGLLIGLLGIATLCAYNNKETIKKHCKSLFKEPYVKFTVTLHDIDQQGDCVEKVLETHDLEAEKLKKYRKLLGEANKYNLNTIFNKLQKID